jgi:hypothetical protein
MFIASVFTATRSSISRSLAVMLFVTLLSPLMLGITVAQGDVARGDETRPDERIRPGTSGAVGCGPARKVVQRLVIDRPGVYENYLVDGKWGDHTLVQIKASNVVLRNCEIRNGTKNAVTVYASDVVIESCKIHHALAGSFDQQKDAHGITGRPVRLIIRNCDIGLVSGDAIQFDPGRGVWGDVLIEHCTLWTAPLPDDAAGFRRGQRPGENALDTKQIATNARSRITVRNCLMYGWNQLAQINNMAALNLKNHIEATVENCVFRDNEIALRVRGQTDEHGGARVSIDNCVVYDTKIALRAEDKPAYLQVRRLGVGHGTDRLLRVAGAGKASELQSIDHYTPPPYEQLIESGLSPNLARNQSAKEQP